jgi:acyl-CoA synthetase (AMP-forming)/AMP-acid ligase II
VTGVIMEIRGPDGTQSGVDEPGEIWLESEMMMNGYANRPEKTAAARIDGWYKDGYPYLTDRIKDMIISGGENVYPIEVENALRAHPGIADVAVIGLDDDKWGQIVATILELRPGTELSFEEVRNFAKERIAGYKCPRAAFATEDLPRTPTAKIQRNLVRGSIAHLRRL